jgi:hypothetical protein
MTVADGDPVGAHEVDAAMWVPLPEARNRLTYPRDVVVLDALVEVAGE